MNEICGGPNRLTPDVHPYIASDGESPNRMDRSRLSDDSTRALTVYGYTSDNMIIDSCLSTCASRGLSLAGIEYGSECYCESAFEDGLLFGAND